MTCLLSRSLPLNVRRTRLFRRNNTSWHQRTSLLPTSRCATKRLDRPQHRNFFSKIQTVFRSILTGDDHVNPKKLLERRYIYLNLLAIEFRSLRLNQQQLDQPQDKDALYEQAIDILDKRNFDDMSNDRLRIELQEALHFQVVEVFQAFHRVDNELGLRNQLDHRKDKNPFHRLEWGAIISILEHERLNLTTRQRQQSDASACFFDAKQQALDTLLTYHSSGDASPDANDAFGANTTELAPASLSLMRQYQSINLARSAKLRDALGYSVLSLRSGIPNAGRGVYVDGSTLAGSLLAFQPGDVWPKEHLLTTAPDVMEHFENDDHCHISLRFDDYVVDSRQSPVTVLMGDDSSTHNNPWALGHMVNHPPLNTKPNCLSTMIDFTEHIMDELVATDGHTYLPNAYARSPGWKSRAFHAEPTVMHGLCLTARQDVCNQELVYDYRLQSEETPEWYSVAESGIMEDEQVVFFRDDWMNKK